ncbi:MAG: hypothetical protein PVG92_00405 [Holophagae bacterium]
MVYRTQPQGGMGFGGFGGSNLPVPRDVIAMLATLFVTYSMRFFAATAFIPEALSLSPNVLRGFVWQIVSYPAIGLDVGGLWFLLQLLILFWFSRDVFQRLGRRRFWLLVARAALGAAVAAVVALLLVRITGTAPDDRFLFSLMQGQLMLLTITIAAFATLYGDATILLFFVLPIRARWFLWLEILFAFMGFLGTKDLPGFVGVCVAVFLTYSGLQGRGARGVLHNWRKRLEAFILRQRLERLKRKRKFDVIDGSDDEYIH